MGSENAFFSPITGTKNKIINGDMRVSQRGTSFTIGQTGGGYTLDRYYIECNHDAGNITISQAADGPNSNFRYSFKLTNAAGNDTSIAAGQYIDFQHRLEGYNLVPLLSNKVTLSFWVKSSKTGTYYAGFRNVGVDRSYVGEYIISSANTWEFKTITIDVGAVSGGTWNYINGVGLYITFSLACGSTYQTTAGAWQTGNYFSTSNQTNWLNETNNTFYITGIQLEQGSQATSFEQRSFATEEFLCLRYFEILQGYIVGGLDANYNYWAQWCFKTRMRGTPIITAAGGSYHVPYTISPNEYTFYQTLGSGVSAYLTPGTTADAEL
jgi:hypothetical protein